MEYLPNYKDGSILNLTASIEKALGGKPKYKPLKILPPETLKDSTNIILLVIDGLGYEFLKKYGKNTTLKENIKGKITSIFPSSTSAAMTAIYTGQSANEHGISGWFTFLKEINQTIIPLPFIERVNRTLLKKSLKHQDFFKLNPLPNRIKAKSYIINPKNIANSRFTKAVAGKAKRLSYKNSKDLFKIIKKAIKSSKKRKYILSYYSEYDTLCHKIGSKSKRTQKNLKNLDKNLKIFIKSIKNTNTTIIIIADHGSTDTPKSKVIYVQNHPKLEETLEILLCGEQRFAYCYIKPGKEKQFVNYIKTKLKNSCNLHKSQDLLKKKYFGLFKTHPKIKNRIGNYTLIMKDKYSIYDPPDPKNKSHHISDHGGLSKDEMFVPLIVIKP